jgi:hypothetical protein
MSRRQRKLMRRQLSTQNTTPLQTRLVTAILKLPRIARIVISLLFALAVTLALSPIVDNIYLTYMFTPETVIVPALVSTAFGIVMYVLGWQLIIGTVGENPPARFIILWYVGIGVLAIFLVAVWMVSGITIGNAPTI